MIFIYHCVNLVYLFFSVNSPMSSNDTEPTEAVIKELGVDNVFWTPAELDLMSNRTFLAAVDILGSVPGYSSNHLKVLYRKAVEVKSSK